MLSFFAAGVDIKVIVLPAQGQGLLILKLVPYFTFYTGIFVNLYSPPPHHHHHHHLPIQKSTNFLNVNPWVKKQVPLTHSRTALQDTGCAVSTGALNILHFTKMGLKARMKNPDSSWHHWTEPTLGDPGSGVVYCDLHCFGGRGHCM